MMTILCLNCNQESDNRHVGCIGCTFCGHLIALVQYDAENNHYPLCYRCFASLSENHFSEHHPSIDII